MRVGLRYAKEVGRQIHGVEAPGDCQVATSAGTLSVGNKGKELTRLNERGIIVRHVTGQEEKFTFVPMHAIDHITFSAPQPDPEPEPEPEPKEAPTPKRRTPRSKQLPSEAAQEDQEQAGEGDEG
jgi:hypothetical protein